MSSEAATLAAPRLAPGPGRLGTLSSILRFWRDPLEALAGTVREHGDLVRFQLGSRELFIVNDADHAEHVLVRNHKNYRKSRHYSGLKRVLGEGLVTSDGAHWQRQHKLVTPAFHHASLVGFAETMVRATDELVGRWASLPPGVELDLHEQMVGLTFRIAGLTLFGTDLAADSRDFGEALLVALRYAHTMAGTKIQFPLWMPTPENVRFKRALARLDGVVHRIIREHRETPRRDLLGALMSANVDGDTMSERQLRDEAVTLLSAGHETTANALAWTFLLLAGHPAVEARLRDELEQVLGTEPVTASALPRLDYTERVIQESLRLYPPVWVFEREAIDDDVLGGFRIPRGAALSFSPYMLHRNPRYWEDPLRFDPDRFSPERSKGRARAAYIPFAVGPRVCIGNSFALMEVKLVVATILRKFRVELVPGQQIEPDPSTMTLRPRHGVAVKLVRA